jgi:hypothetical protein
MATFLVERHLVDWSTADVDRLTSTLAAAGSTLGEHGVRHVQTVIVAADETCWCLFDADTADQVIVANRALGLPFSRVAAAEYVHA